MRDIFFYLDLILGFAALCSVATVAALYKKTVAMRKAGIVSLAVFGAAFVAFVVELALVALKPGLDAVIYVAFAALCAGFISSSVYAISVAYRMSSKIGIAVGALAVIPVVGSAALLWFVNRLRNDSSAKELIFSGHTYTVGALTAFVERYTPEFIDSSDELKPEKALAKREVGPYLKGLKARAKDPDGLVRYAEGLMCYRPNKLKTAAAALFKAAKQNNPEALFNLGLMYETGTVYKKNVAAAIDCYRKAAELGDRDSQLRLGVVEILFGDPSAGVEIFRKREAAGDRSGTFNLALCYEKGAGVERDLERALELYEECARRGMIEAQRRMFALGASSIDVIAELFDGKTKKKKHGNAGAKTTGSKRGKNSEKQNVGELTVIAESERQTVLRKVGDAQFSGGFGEVMRGLNDIRSKNTNAAAEHFVTAVLARGKWEGMARLLVGTLYIDRGKLADDKKNGAAYVRSAIGFTPVADDIFAVVPHKFKKGLKPVGAGKSEAPTRPAAQKTPPDKDN